jgi:hypothetical protein
MGALKLKILAIFMSLSLSNSFIPDPSSKGPWFDVQE